MTQICPACHRPIYAIAGLHFDVLTGVASRNGKSVRLTHSRARIFGMFVSKPGHVITREMMENELYGLKPFADWPETNSLTVMVCHLRKQVRGLDLSIKNVHGCGWVLQDVA